MTSAQVLLIVEALQPLAARLDQVLELEIEAKRLDLQQKALYGLPSPDKVALAQRLAALALRCQATEMTGPARAQALAKAELMEAFAASITSTTGAKAPKAPKGA